MKIALLGDPLDTQYAGIHYAARGMIKALTEQDRSNSYIVIRSKSGEKLGRAEELVVPSYSAIPGQRTFRMFGQIPHLLTKHGFDLAIETAQFGPFNLPPRIKRVSMIYDLTTIFFPRMHVLHNQLLHRLFFPRIVKNADLLIACSNCTAKDLAENLPQSVGKTVVVPLSHDSMFKPTLEPSVLKRLGVTDRYLLYVGTIEPRKNLKVLLEAYAKFRAENEERFQLVIVGKSGWKNQDFYSQLGSHPFKGEVVLTGYLPRAELPALYSQCEAFIFPSLYEGFGLPLLEAMACGAPCLSSDRSSLPEVGGMAPIYFNPESSSELAAQLIFLRNQPEERARLKAQSLAQANIYCWHKSAGKLAQAISEIPRRRH